MNNEKTSISVPLALQELILTSNELLINYQKEIQTKVSKANIEMMQLLNLNPNDGWKLDMDSMTYIKTNNAPSVSE